MYWTVRPLEDEDHPSVLEIQNQSAHDPVTLEEFRRRVELTNRVQLMSRIVAEDADGSVAGYAFVRSAWWLRQGTAFAGVYVEQGRQRQGLGELLLKSVEEQAGRWGYKRTSVQVRDDLPAVMAFCVKRGYEASHQFFDSELDLSAFDSAAFAGARQRAEALGYRFISMAEWPDQEEARRRLFELDCECSVDEPDKTEGWQAPTFEEYAPIVFDPAQFDPKGVCIALKDGDWVAMSGLHFPPNRDRAWTFMTGVRRGHRGLGLSLATKIPTLEYAIARGCKRAGTGNHSKNEAMLATNIRLGYQRKPGWFQLYKEL